MTRLAVLIGDRPGQVDQSLLGALLRRWAKRSGVEVELAVESESLPDVDDAVDGMVVDVELRPGTLPAGAESIPIVHVDVTDALGSAPVSGRLIRGRGIETYVWATRHLFSWLRWRPAVIPYGEHPDQVGELRVPTTPGPHPVVVLIHGGFWRSHWERDLMDDVAIDLAGAGLATWNIEYRRGPGSWADALEDVGRAIDHLVDLAAEHRLATEQTALVGHSAGGHLALWAGGQRRHGGEALLDPVLVLPLAPVSDLVECAARNLGEGAAVEFFGAAPDAAPDRYTQADPMQRLPVGVATTIVQGMADSPDLVDLNRRFASRAAAVGERIELLELEGTDHFDVIDPASDAWGRVRRLLVEQLTPVPERNGRP
jgi:acetyl esterase/lipase